MAKMEDPFVRSRAAVEAGASRVRFIHVLHGEESGGDAPVSSYLESMAAVITDSSSRKETRKLDDSAVAKDLAALLWGGWIYERRVVGPRRPDALGRRRENCGLVAP